MDKESKHISIHGVSLYVKKTTVLKVDLFYADLILIPVQFGAHWAVIFASPHNHMIEYYDSLLNDGERCLSHIR